MELLKFEPPKSRLVWSVDSFEDAKGYEKFIQTHWFNQQIEVILGNGEEVSDELNLPKNISYYEVELQLTDIISPTFIHEFVENSEIYALSIDPLDKSHVSIALLPSGKLILHVSKVVYEELGLEGQPAAMSGYHKITINLKAPNFKPGEKFYERVKWCVTDRVVDPMVVLLCVTKNNRCVPLHYSSDTFQILQVHQAEHTQDSLTDIKLPLFPQIQLSELPLEQLQQTTDLHAAVSSFLEQQHDNEEQYTDQAANIHEWIGMVSNRLTKYLHAENGLFMFEGSSESGSCYMHRCRGFVPPHVIQEAVAQVRAMVDSKKIPFGVISMWGFNDSPVSWNENSHGVLIHSENDYSLVILPGGIYWKYIAMGPQDTFTT
mmetsp:Transcript_18541/g.25999  ORF Transcript_18541/g.25999 Transcript_18541/m.25999 type:complete len:376 (+) Transcript_18541:128-1255(+)